MNAGNWIPVQCPEEAAVKQRDRPGQSLVNLVPSGGEDLDDDVWDEDQDNGDAAVEPQTVQAEGDRQDDV